MTAVDAVAPMVVVEKVVTWKGLAASPTMVPGTVVSSLEEKMLPQTRFPMPEGNWVEGIWT